MFIFNASTRCLKLCYFKYLQCTCTVLRNIDKNLVTQFFITLAQGSRYRASIRDSYGQFLLLLPNYYQFSFCLSGHVADLVGFLTLDPSLIWNAARDNSKIPIREENLASVLLSTMEDVLICIQAMHP